MAQNQITIELNKSIEVTLGDNAITIEASSVDALRTYLAEDQKLYFNGNNGNSYLVYNSTSGALELYVNGSRKARWS